jgi:alkylhydroperoxidase family enzyme
LDAISEGKLEHPSIDDKTRAMLRYVKILTERPGSMRDSDAEDMRKAGWTDEQIFETAFITALFAFFNRMADAYGLEYPARGYIPPADRSVPK